MNKEEFLNIVRTEIVRVNDNPVDNVSEAVVAIGHLADGTEPPGKHCTATTECMEAWDNLSNEEQCELWDLACKGVLDEE